MFAECCSEQPWVDLCSIRVCGLPARIRTAAWSLALIWTGVALLMDVGLGVGLLGVGMIILGEQVARRYFNLKLQWFWITVGLLCVGFGLWYLYGLKLVLVRQPL